MRTIIRIAFNWRRVRLALAASWLVNPFIQAEESGASMELVFKNEVAEGVSHSWKEKAVLANASDVSRLNSPEDFNMANLPRETVNHWDVFSEGAVSNRSRFYFRYRIRTEGDKLQGRLLHAPITISPFDPIDEVRRNAASVGLQKSTLADRAVGIDFSGSIAPDGYEKFIRELPYVEDLVIAHGFIDFSAMNSNFPKSLKNLTLVDFPLSPRLLNVIRSIKGLETLSLINSGCFDVVASPLSREAERSDDWISHYNSMLEGAHFHDSLRIVRLFDCDEQVYLAFSRLAIPSLKEMELRLRPAYFGGNVIWHQTRVLSTISTDSGSGAVSLSRVTTHIDEEERAIIELKLVKKGITFPELISGYYNEGVIEEAERARIRITDLTKIGRN